MFVLSIISSFVRREFRTLSLLGLAAIATGALPAQPLPTPAFSREATVHDPSLVRAGAEFYVFGSHLASARSTDLMSWTQLSTSAAAGNVLVPNPAVEFREVLTWAQTNTFWAPDVIRLNDGRYYLYYCACRGDSPLSAMGLAVADSIAGPYSHVAVLLKSGMAGTSEDGTPYNATIHPNVVDPAVFFDQAGKLWMVYGSYSGGIFILEMDPTTGRQKPGQGYGKKLIGKNHSRIEGAYILYSPETEYYYLFLSFGGLNAADGYNIRVARSKTPDGPFLDASGADLTNVGGANGTFFDDAAIAPYGVKLMGSYQFAHVAGEPQTTSRGYRSPGHNSAYYDPATGKYSLVFHTRFVGRGEQHEVRVHQMFLNEQDWFVVAPHRYAGETIQPITARQIPGEFKWIDHGKAISGTVNTSTLITLNADGSVTGGLTGKWRVTGDNFATLALSGVIYRGVFVRQWDDDNQVWVLGFTALSDNGTAWWGSKVAAPNAVVAPTITSQPLGQALAPGGAATLTGASTGTPAPELQWEKNGTALAGASGLTFTIGSTAPGDAGIYRLRAGNFAGATASTPAIVGLASTTKIVGEGEEVLSNQYVARNGNTFDQVLLTAEAVSVRADYSPDPTQNQITRTSYIDPDDDIVQVEMSGPGTLSLVLEESSGPAVPVKYVQAVSYMKGRAGIVITGATENTHLSVFSVGRANAVNSALFPSGMSYDGIADIAFVAITSTDGRFGGLRTANTCYAAAKGLTGVLAPGIAFTGSVFVGEISASGTAEPVLLLGSSIDVRITGGDLFQPNGQPVQVSGLTQLRFTAGQDSHGNDLPAKPNRAVLQQNGQDVTTQLVVNP
jgi:arabinan endo-1,5-alpha-L-arabinosidase